MNNNITIDDIPSIEKPVGTNKFYKIESSDTIEEFMTKCNANFSNIISKNGGPQGNTGEKGDPGVPTKPKVSIHVWKDGVEYVNESHDSDNNIFYIDDNNIKEDLAQEKYKVGHLIILENGNVYILEESNKVLKPKFKLSLIVYSDIKDKVDTIGTNIDDIKSDIENINSDINTNLNNINSDINKIDSDIVGIKSDLDYIKSQKIGGVNLIDRTAFEIYKNDKDENLNNTTYIITNQKNTYSRNFGLHKRNLKNTTFTIIDKSEYKNSIYTNSIKIDATDIEVSDTDKTENYGDITQLLNYKNTSYTFLKPNTVYTLYCKYKCKREETPYDGEMYLGSSIGGLYITNVNPNWIRDNDEDGPIRNDLATLFKKNVINDWEPIKITFETGSNVGYAQNEQKGCILHIRAMSGCWIEICELKLEEGNMQTQWSESHSDIISRIKQASSSSSVNSNISISNIIYETDNFHYINLNNINDPCFNSDTIIINGDNSTDKPICILLPTDKIYNNDFFYEKTIIEYVSNNGKTIKIKNLSDNKCFVALPSNGESCKLYQINSKIPINEDETVTSMITLDYNNIPTTYKYIEIGNNYSEFVCFNNNIWCQTK